MNDLISRQAAIEQARRNWIDNEAWIGEIQAELLSNLPSVNQWIPCRERLPEKSGRYLVTNTRLGAFEVAWNIFYNGKGEAPEGWLYEDGTIAWRPLPEPYKGEEE